MSDAPATTTTEDELAASLTPGYKAPAVKTLDELKDLDKNDESLNKWKETLLKAGSGPKDDPRKVVVLSLSMETDGRPDVVLDLSTPGTV